MNRFTRIRDTVVPALEPYGLRRVAVFGSYARGDDRPDSDIDVLISLEQPRRKPLGYLTLVRLEEELSHALGRKVDLVTDSGLSRHIRPHVEADMVVVYENRS